MSRHSMTSIQRSKLLLWIYIVFLALLSVGIILMPIGSIYKDKTMILMYLSGAGFWIGIVGTICTAIKINSDRKHGNPEEQIVNAKQIGLICFFKNKEAIIADVAMIASLVGFVIAKIFVDHLIVSFVFLAVLIFAFGMHCMLNGINYRYIKKM